MSYEENNNDLNENEVKKFEDLSEIEINGDMRRIIKKISAIVGVYVKLQYIRAFTLDIQLYDHESRIWLEADLKGIKGMLYSFNIDLIDDEAIKYFGALQMALFKENMTIDDRKIDFKYEISNRHRNDG